MASPSSSRAPKRSRSSTTEHSFQGIQPPPACPRRRRWKVLACVRYDLSPMSRAAHKLLKKILRSAKNGLRNASRRRQLRRTAAGRTRKHDHTPPDGAVSQSPDPANELVRLLAGPKLQGALRPRASSRDEISTPEVIGRDHDACFSFLWLTGRRNSLPAPLPLVAGR